MDPANLTGMKCRACAKHLMDTVPNFTSLLESDAISILRPSTDNCDNVTHNFVTISRHNTSSFGRIEDILYSKVVVAMCFVGLIGNFLNLIVLVPRGLRHISGRMEKFAYSGLIALALANMLFCLTTIPYGFLTKQKLYSTISFTLVFYTYNNAIINTFILASTWLTVTLAVGRYFAVCYPLRAREVLGMTCAKRTITAVGLVCVLFNIPRFFTYSIVTANCGDGSSLYFQYYGQMKLNPTFDLTFNWSYFVFGIMLPLCLLIFCNAYLIYTLRMYRVTQDRMRATRTQKETSNHMTLTLIVIIVMYILLVSPAEMINFFRQPFLGNRSNSETYNLAVAIVNTLQAFNFAFTFVPYCAINIHLRKTITRVLSRKRNSNKRHCSKFDSPFTSNSTPDHAKPEMYSI